MSFGGSVQAMITTLKNNARSRSTLFDKKYSSTKEKQTGIPVKKISQKDLEKIRIHLQRENKLRTRKRFFLFSFVFIAIVIATIYFLENLV